MSKLLPISAIIPTRDRAAPLLVIATLGFTFQLPVTSNHVPW